MRQTLLKGILFTVGLMIISPAALALGRGTTLSFCTNAVHGTCWVSKRDNEPYVSVRFKCQVNAEDHPSHLMAAANYEYALDPDQAEQHIVNQPRPGPIHDSHVYCREGHRCRAGCRNSVQAQRKLQILCAGRRPSVMQNQRTGSR